MDVTETAIDRQKTHKKDYSCNKKYHTLKMQAVIDRETGTNDLPKFWIGAFPRFQLV
ncbi:MAG: transposase family protein [Microcoleus sp.]|uniref:transposase family protein n=1 Tax=Microcoleus sp. TaxID=44472 RepID=UPI003C79501A